MRIGIDKIAFYVPNYYLDLSTLAKARNVDENKFYKGLMQDGMVVLPPHEDIVTMASEAAKALLSEEDRAQIDLLIFATESGIDQSKCAGVYAHELVGLSKTCRTIELKQACYSSTAGLRFAINHVTLNPNKKALLIASDNARYGLNSSGEATQGCGAVAMIISSNPSIMEFDNYTGFVTKDVMDFWRPNFRNEALVDGKYSMNVYLETLIETWKDYQKQCGRSLSDHYKICYHVPFSKMALKAHAYLCKSENEDQDNSLNEITYYNRLVGNCYTGSLYLSLISLLEKVDNLDGKRIGMFSYGSGCVGEFFSGVVCDNYKKSLLSEFHKKTIQNRKEVDINLYEQFYLYQNKFNTMNLDISQDFVCDNNNFVLTKVEDGKRTYVKRRQHLARS